MLSQPPISPKSPDAKPVNFNTLIDTPRSYTLQFDEDKNDSSELCFYVLGCAGSLDVAQKQVAELMNEIASKKTKPKFIILLGDNFYNKGLESPVSTAFDENFYNVYHHSSVSSLCNIPFFIILGNHDHNLHWWKPGGGVDYGKVSAQVMRTFVDDTGEISAEKMKVYEAPTLKLKNLPKWNMPSRFYILRFQQVEMFFIDSSTYVKDYLAALKDPSNMLNQAIWLQNEALKNGNTRKLLFLHHPLLTMGKRAFYATNSFDSGSYLTLEEMAKLSELQLEGCYSAVLRQIFARQGISFNTVFAAHDHCIYYYNNQNDLCQIVAGGGGGQRQNRLSFQDYANVPTFLNDYGFVEVGLNGNFPQKPMTFDFYNLNDVHLQFSQHSNKAIRRNVMDDRGVGLLNEVVMPAYAEYFRFLKSRQDDSETPGQFLHWGIGGNFKHGIEGVERADNLRNFFNRYTSISFQQATDYLKNVAFNTGTASDHSLITFIKTELKGRFDLTWEQFVADPNIILTGKPQVLEEKLPEDINSPKIHSPKTPTKSSYSFTMLNNAFCRVAEVLSRQQSPQPEANNQATTAATFKTQ